MRLLFLLVWKHWASSPLRLLLTWFGVVLGVAIVTGIHVLDHNTILSQLEQRRGDFGRVDLELRPKGSQPSLDERRQQLEQHGDIERVGLLAQSRIQVIENAAVVQQVSIFGLAPVGGDWFGHYRVAQGRDLNRLDPEHRVLVSPVFAAARGLQPGSRFQVLALPLAKLVDCIDGRLVHAKEQVGQPVPGAQLEVVGILEPFRLARQNAGNVIISSYGLTSRLGRSPSPIIQVNRRAGVDPSRLVTELEQDYFVDRQRSAMIGERADERAFRNGVKVLGCLALILGMFVIFHTLSYSLAEKIRRIGILRTLGALPGQIARVFLLDAFLISILGSIFGLLAGLLLAWVLKEAGITTLGLGKSVTTFELPWSQLAAIAMLGVFFTMLGAAFPLMKVRNLSPTRILYVRDLAPPADLMRGVNVFMLLILVVALPLAYLAMTPLLSDAGRGAGIVLLQAGGIVAVFFAVLLLSPRLVRTIGGLPLRLSRSALPLASFLVGKNLLRAPSRLATPVCGLTLVALAMLGLAGLTGALKEELRDFAKEGLHGRLFVRFAPDKPLAESDWKALKNLEGVHSVLPMSAIHHMPFIAFGTDSEDLDCKGGALEGRPALVTKMKDRRCLVISRRLASLKGYELGQMLPVLAGKRVQHYEVIAISDKDGFFPDERAYALADRTWFKLDFCLNVDLASDFAVRIDPTRKQEIERALRKLPGKLAWIKPGEGIEEFHLADIDRDFFFFDILLLLLLILAGTGQVNLITLATISRAREIGVLRALGMTRGDFVRVLLLEASVVGLITALLTIAAGLPMILILIRGLREVSGLEVPFYLPVSAALWISAVSFLVAMAASLLPAIRATGLPAAVAVRSSE